MKIKISIKLFATLREFLPENHNEFQIDEGLTVGDIVDLLGIKRDEVRIIFLNNKISDFSTKLKNNDNLSLFPPIGGG